jgi:two-component system, NtrC family, response regulator AtoC
MLVFAGEFPSLARQAGYALASDALMDPLASVIGQSSRMVAVHAQVRRLLSVVATARRIPPVLLRGETGTGKGLMARSLHAASPRANGRFVSVNCAAIPETLLEAELFGFERGAFTDARQAKPGLFQEAHGGTLFLDEAGLLPESLQAKLLTALDERAVRRLGGTRTEPTDCWIIAATSADLEQARKERRFREDLYHRLSVFTICLPPLRERGDDVLRLAEAFLERIVADYGLPPRTLDDPARGALRRYGWPGNVRELGNILERAALLSETPVIGVEELGLPSGYESRGDNGSSRGSCEGPGRDLRESLGDIERARLVDALTQAHWNVSVAAELLGIPRNTLRYRVEKYGLTRPDDSVPRRRSIATAQPERSAPAQPLRWEPRTVTWLRATVTGESISEVSRLVALFACKVTTFGGEIMHQMPGSLDAAFGLEASEDASTRAANAALAIGKAAAKIAVSGHAPAVTLALHASRCAVGLGQARPWPDQESLRAADEELGKLVAATRPGDTALSSTVAPLLARRFHIRAPATGP